MIALCPSHHRKADAGVISKDQLNKMKMKISAKKEFENVKGDFEWMRRKILLVAGGNFFYDNKVAISLRGMPLIWFSVDEEGYKLLNLKLYDQNGNLRVHIEDNIWLVKTDITDIECPPSGKELKIYLDNGDNIRLKFIEIESQMKLIEKYPSMNPEVMAKEYPFSALNVAMKLKSYNIDFQERKTNIANGKLVMTNCFARGNGTGLSL